MLPYLLAVLGFLLVLAVLLYWVNPLAPLLLLLSIIIQAPLIYLIARYTYSGGYRDRVLARREKNKEDGDDAGWLEKEEQEAASFGYRLLPAKDKAENILLRAGLLLNLGRRDEAAQTLLELELPRLSSEHLSQYKTFKIKIEGESGTVALEDGQ